MARAPKTSPDPNPPPSACRPLHWPWPEAAPDGHCAPAGIRSCEPKSQDRTKGSVLDAWPAGSAGQPPWGHQVCASLSRQAWVSPPDAPAAKADWQISPGNAHPPSRLCPPHLRPRFPHRYRTLKIFAFSSSMGASYAISVRRASALPAASFRSHLTMGTLAVRLTLPPVGCVEDLHLQVNAPCRAHKKEPDRRWAVRLSKEEGEEG